MIYLMFKLSLYSPHGKWNKEDRLYAVVRKFDLTKKGRALAERVLNSGGFYSYVWSDGWHATITVKKLDAKQAKDTKKKSVGFCGYDWMIDNIISHGSCYGEGDVKA